MGLQRFLARQAKRPSGWFGKLLTGRIFNRGNATLEDMALELISASGAGILLEIGFGNGRFIWQYIAQHPDAKVFGIDLSPEMVRQASQRNKAAIASGQVQLQEGSVASLPFPDRHFDVVFTANTIYFWPDPKENIREIMRVLKPGGTFFCGFRTEEQMNSISVIRNNRQVFCNLYSLESMQQFLEAAGFTEVKVESRPAEPIDNHIAVATKL